MTCTQIQLNEEHSLRVQDFARRENISMTEVVHRAVDYWLKLQNESFPEDRWQRASQVAGRFQSGIVDLAERHDEYLVDAYEDCKG